MDQIRLHSLFIATTLRPRLRDENNYVAITAKKK